MDTLQVENRGGGLWFALGAILFVLAAIIAFFASGIFAWIASSIVIALAIAAISWGLYGAKRFIEFGERIVVHYFRRQRTISWDDVTFISCERFEGRARTGIPFVSIPTENHTVTIRLKDGGSLSADIEPSRIPAIHKITERYATLDFEREQRRLAAEAISEHKFDLLGWVALGLAFFVMGVCFTVYMLEEIVDGGDSSDWPVAPGQISSSHVASKKSGETLMYSPAVRYTYSVNGEEHTGNRFKFSPAKNRNREVIQALVEEYRPGSEIDVRYKPDDPSVSVLIPGIDDHRYIVFDAMIVGGIAGLVFAIVNFVRYMRARSTQLVT